MKLTVKQVSAAVSASQQRVWRSEVLRIDLLTDELNKLLEETQPAPAPHITKVCGDVHDPFRCNLDPNHEGAHGQLNHYGTGGIWWERKEETPAPTEEDYPGQSFFQRNNPDIRRAEELIAEIKRKRAENPTGWLSYPERVTATLKKTDETLKAILDMQEQGLRDLYAAVTTISEPQDCRPENPCRLCLSKEHS